MANAPMQPQNNRQGLWSSTAWMRPECTLAYAHCATGTSKVSFPVLEQMSNALLDAITEPDEQ